MSITDNIKHTFEKMKGEVLDIYKHLEHKTGMHSKNLEIGDTVGDSPLGEGGKVTGFNPDGYPEVNGQAVSYITRTDGEKYGAFGTLDTPGRKMGDKVDSATAVSPMTGADMGLTQNTDMGGKPANVVTQPGFVPHEPPQQPAAEPVVDVPPTIPTEPNKEGSPTPVVAEHYAQE